MNEGVVGVAEDEADADGGLAVPGPVVEVIGLCGEIDGAVVETGEVIVGIEAWAEAAIGIDAAEVHSEVPSR